MDIIQLLALKKEVECGKYACLATCCDILPALFSHVRSMTEDELALFYDWLCTKGCPDGNAGGGGVSTQADCTTELRTLVCTEAVQNRAKIGKTVLDAALAVWPNPDPLPVVHRAYQAASHLLGIFLEFCARPKETPVDDLLTKLCEYYRIIRGAAASMTNLPPPLDRGTDAINQSLFPSLRQALDRCCADQGTRPTVTLEPGTVQALVPLPGATTRPLTLSPNALGALRRVGSNNPFGF